MRTFATGLAIALILVAATALLLGPPLGPEAVVR